MKKYVDLQWEIDRYRLAKSKLIDGARKEALQVVLESVLEPDDCEHAVDLRLEAAAKAHEWYMDDAENKSCWN